MDVTVFTIPIAGSDYQVAGQVSGAGTEAVIFLHGGPGGNRSGPHGLFDVFAPTLAQAGLLAVQFDFRGSGQADFPLEEVSLESQVEDLRAVGQFVREELGCETARYVGESLGATVLLHALEEGLEFGSVAALLWPALNLFDTDLSVYLTSESVDAARANGYIQDGDMVLGRRFLEECLTVDVGRGLGKIDAPVLVIHGTSDSEVPVEHSLRVAAFLGDLCKFVPVEGGDHGLARPKEREIVVNELESLFVDR